MKKVIGASIIAMVLMNDEVLSLAIITVLLIAGLSALFKEATNK